MKKYTILLLLLTAVVTTGCGKNEEPVSLDDIVVEDVSVEDTVGEDTTEKDKINMEPEEVPEIASTESMVMDEIPQEHYIQLKFL